MADNQDIFDSLGAGPDSGKLPPPVAAPLKTEEPGSDPEFEKIMPRPDPIVSTATAFTRSFGSSVLPAAASIFTGALAGAGGGAVGGPFGTVAGALVGGFGGGMAASAAQNYAVSKLPDDWQEAIGQSDRDLRLAQEQHPYASFLGGMAPFALTGKPFGGAAKAELPQNATNLERLMANPMTARLFSGAIVGGAEAANEEAHGESPNWVNVATATAFGMVFTHPTYLGEAIEGAAAATARGFRPRSMQEPASEPTSRDLPFTNEYEPFQEGLPSGYYGVTDNGDGWRRLFVKHGEGIKTPPTLADLVDSEENPWEAMLNRPKEQLPGPVFPFTEEHGAFTEELPYALDFLHEEDPWTGLPWTEESLRETYSPPTLADADDLGVLGPGAIEDTFSGELDRDYAATQAAHAAKAAMMPDMVNPVDVEARLMEPELFSAYDAAIERQELLREEIKRYHGPSIDETLDIENQIENLKRQLPKNNEYKGGRDNRKLRADIRFLEHKLNEMQTQREAFLKQREEFFNGESVEPSALNVIRQKLVENDYELRDISKEIARVRLRAAEKNGVQTLPELLPKSEPDEIKPDTTTPPKYKVNWDRETVGNKWPPAEKTETIEVPMEALAEAFKRDDPQAQIENPRADVVEHIGSGKPVSLPEIDVSHGKINVTNGRNRIAAAKAIGETTIPINVPKEQVDTVRELVGIPKPPRSLQEQHDFIVADTKAKMIAAGRPEDEAEATAQLRAAYYMRLADRFKGVIGSPEEIYRAKAADIIKSDGTKNKTNEISYDQFGGERAKTANLNHLAIAKEMEANKENRGSIFDKTGWYKDVDGNWKFVIPSENVKLKISSDDLSRSPIKLDNVIDAQNLFSAYPELRDIKVNKGYVEWGSAQWDGHSKTITISEKYAENKQLLKSIIHEVQHAIQNLEKHAPGSNPIGSGMGEDRYLRAAGEVEARNAEIWYKKNIKGRLLQPKEVRDMIAQAKKSKASKNEIKALNDLLKNVLETQELSATVKDVFFQGSRKFHEELKNASEKGASVETLEKMVSDYHANKPRKTEYPWETRDVEEENILQYPYEDKFEELKHRGLSTQKQAEKLLTRKPESETIKNETLLYIINNNGNKEEILKNIDDDISNTRYKIEKEKLKKVRDYVVSSMTDLNDARHLFKDEDYIFYQKQFENELRQKSNANISWPKGLNERAVIKIFETADASSVPHELAHEWLNDMMHNSMHPAAPADLVLDASAIARWLGVSKEMLLSPANGQKISREARRAHEKFARGFEQYLREGRAPSAGLARVFAQFKQWLSQIYQTLKGLGSPINDEIRNVFDRMLAEPGQRVTIESEHAQPLPLHAIHAAEAREIEAPHAEAAADRVKAEREHIANEPPEDAVYDIAEAVKAFEEQTASEGRSPDVSGNDGASSGGLREVERSGEETGIKPSRDVVGVGASEKRESGNRPPMESAGVERSGGGPATRDPGRPGPLPLAPKSKERIEPATFNVGRNGNVRVENLTSRKDLIDAIQEAVDRNVSPAGDRPLTQGEALDFAQTIGADPKNVTPDGLARIFGGVKDLTSKVMFLRQAVIDQSKIYADAAARAANGSDKDVLEYGEERERLKMITGVLSSVTTEVGRGLGMGFKNKEAMKGAKDLAALARTMTGTSLNQLRIEAKLAKNFKTTAQLANWAKTTEKRSFGRMLLEYFVNNLISGLQTHVTYVTGGQILLVSKMVPETLMAAAVGRLRQQMGVEGDRVFAGESGAQLREWSRALPKAFQAAFEALRSGHTTALPGEEQILHKLFEGDPEVSVLSSRIGETEQKISAARETARQKLIEERKAARAAGNIPPLRDTAAAKEVEEKIIRSLIEEDADVMHLSKTIGNEDVKWHEARATLFGLLRGISDSMYANGKLIAKGGDPDAPIFDLQFSHLGQIPDFAVKGVTIPIGSFWRLPGRGVATLHSWQRTLSYSTEINALAYRISTNEKLTGSIKTDEEFASRVNELRQNPTEQMMEQARGNANNMTLMDAGGVFVKTLSKLMDVAPHLPGLGETPILRFINPFVKIAANIMDRSLIERTPAGLLSKGIRDDLSGWKESVYQNELQTNGKAAADALRIRADMTAARMLVGTAYCIGFGSLAALGYVTGSGPADPGRRNVWIATGHRPHSVRLGDQWFDMHRLGPIGFLLGMTSDMYDVAHLASEGEGFAAANMLVHGMTQNMLDESFMRGTAELLAAIEHPQQEGQRYAQNFTSNFLPMSVGVGYMARAGDPYNRMTRDYVSALKAKIPGLSETLLPRVDIYGNDMPNLSAFPTRYVSAVYQSRMSNDPVVQAIDRAGISIASAREYVRGIKLTDEQFYQFAQTAGRMTKQRFNEWVNSPDWYYMNDEERRTVAATIVEQCRNVARELLMARYPEIAARATQLRRDRFKVEKE